MIDQLIGVKPMGFNNVDIICAALLVLFVVFGFSCSVAAETADNNDQEAWIRSNEFYI